MGPSPQAVYNSVVGGDKSNSNFCNTKHVTVSTMKEAWSVNVVKGKGNLIFMEGNQDSLLKYSGNWNSFTRKPQMSKFLIFSA